MLKCRGFIISTIICEYIEHAHVFKKWENMQYTPASFQDSSLGGAVDQTKRRIHDVTLKLRNSVIYFE